MVGLDMRCFIRFMDSRFDIILTTLLSSLLWTSSWRMESVLV